MEHFYKFLLLVGAAAWWFIGVYLTGYFLAKGWYKGRPQQRYEVNLKTAPKKEI